MNIPRTHLIQVCQSEIESLKSYAFTTWARFLFGSGFWRPCAATKSCAQPSAQLLRWGAFLSASRRAANFCHRVLLSSIHSRAKVRLNASKGFLSFVRVSRRPPCCARSVAVLGGDLSIECACGPGALVVDQVGRSAFISCRHSSRRLRVVAGFNESLESFCREGQATAQSTSLFPRQIASVSS